MGMFEEEEKIGHLAFHSSRPEMMLKVPGLFIIHQTQIDDISMVIHELKPKCQSQNAK
jgi:hypothetical protein